MKNIIYLVIVLVLIGCGTSRNVIIKPYKNSFSTFFGLVLPVFSENKKFFKYTKKVDRARYEFKKEVIVLNGDTSYTVKKLYRDRFDNTVINDGDTIKYTYDFDDTKRLSNRIEYYRHPVNLEPLPKKISLHIVANSNYYQNGMIKKYHTSISSKEELLWSSLDYGKWYVFDDQGEEKFVIDFEKHYAMTLSEVLTLFLQSPLDLKDMKKYYVKRIFDENNAYWIIHYEIPGRGFNIVIDDAARRIINPDNNGLYEDEFTVILKHNPGFDKGYLRSLYARFEAY